ncbi:MAG TPA: hypothetical protein ENJ16_03050 [Planctomycetaceae bacterium]|nr:hypothetical protein [Planctomycetaceae bacterium]
MRQRPERPILDVYAEKRSGQDAALVQDAQRVFEALLWALPTEEIERHVGRIFNRPDEYRKTIRMLKDIAARRQPVSQ